MGYRQRGTKTLMPEKDLQARKKRITSKEPQTRGVIWRDTSEESTRLLEAKYFLRFLCARQNDALWHQKPRTFFTSLLSEGWKWNLLERWFRREDTKWLLFSTNQRRALPFFRPIREEHRTPDDLVILFYLFIFFLGREAQKVREWGVNSLKTSIFPLPTPLRGCRSLLEIVFL